MLRIGRNAVAIVVLTLITAVACTLLGLNNAQIISTTIFGFTVYATLLFWEIRVPFAFLGVVCLLGFGVLDIPHLIEFASFDIILFLIGMMMVAGFLEERRFFEYLLNRIIKIVGPRAERLIIVLMIMAALFAALVDEVTSILFMTATVLHIIDRYKLDPIPFIIMIVFATNIGSSATVVGNPIGVMIALKGGLTFIDFIRWATPISVLALLATILLSTKFFSGQIKELDERMKSSGARGIGRFRLPKKSLRISWALFLGTIVFLVLHQQIEELLHLEKNAMLIGVALAAAAVALFIDRENARELLERRVDWWTLIFFALLFAKVGTLKYVGTTDLIAGALFSVSGGSDVNLLIIFTWVTAVLSGFMDNILAVATFVPVVHDLGLIGMFDFPLWWGMLFAGTFFGNLTMIGSTANIVALGMLERGGRKTVTFSQWIKVGAPIAIITLALAMLLLYLQLPLMPR